MPSYFCLKWGGKFKKFWNLWSSETVHLMVIWSSRPDNNAALFVPSDKSVRTDRDACSTRPDDRAHTIPLYRLANMSFLFFFSSYSFPSNQWFTWLQRFPHNHFSDVLTCVSFFKLLSFKAKAEFFVLCFLLLVPEVIYNNYAGVFQTKMRLI